MEEDWKEQERQECTREFKENKDSKKVKLEIKKEGITIRRNRQVRKKAGKKQSIIHT